jgi:hypothetical protein
MRAFILLICTVSSVFFGAAQNCDCKTLLSEATNIVERNYAGFQEKVPLKKSVFYERFKQKLLTRAMAKKIECIEILHEYLSFFKDPHLILNENKSNFIILKPGEIQKRQKFRDPILGNWYSDLDRAYINIVKSKERYLGYVLTSTDTALKRGTLVYNFKKKSKNEYSGIVYNKYEQKIVYESTVKDGKLIIKSLETLSRKKQNEVESRAFKFSKISDTVCYLKFPSFSLFYKEVCDSIVEKNRSDIEKSKYLVVDVRNNHGGSIYSFRKLFDYIYTEPTRYVSGYYWSSEDNIQKATESLETMKKDEDTAGIAEEEALIDSLNKYKGQFYFQPPDTLMGKKIYLYPKTVILMINENTASAAEMLGIMALQNKKTVIAGVRTYGASDFLEPQFYYLCKKKFLLGIPWIKRSRFEYKDNIDGIGIVPDINLGRINEKDWISYLFKKGFVSIKIAR